MQPADTARAQRMAALAAVNLEEREEPPHPDAYMEMEIETPTPIQPKLEPIVPAPDSIPRSNPSPSELQLHRPTIPALGALASLKSRKRMHPEPTPPTIAPPSVKPPKPIPELQKPPIKQTAVKATIQLRLPYKPYLLPSATATLEPQAATIHQSPLKHKSVSETVRLSRFFTLSPSGSESAASELMLIVSLDSKKRTPVWGCCLLCIKNRIPHIYYQKHPFKLPKVISHLTKSHANDGWNDYIQMDPHRKLDFLRKDPAISFDHISQIVNSKISKHSQMLENGHFVWALKDYHDIYISGFSLEKLQQQAPKGKLPNNIKPPLETSTRASRKSASGADDVRPQKKRKVKKFLGPAVFNPRLHALLNSPFGEIEPTLPVIRSRFCPDDPQNMFGRSSFVEKQDFENKVLWPEHYPHGIFHVTEELKRLPSFFPDDEAQTHSAIPELIVNGDLKDPLLVEPQASKDAFLIPRFYLPYSEEMEVADRDVSEYYARRLISLYLFYSMRGMPTHIIAKFLDMWNNEDKQLDGKSPRSVLPLVVYAGNSVCAESLRGLRSLCDKRNTGSDRTVLLLTKPCPELGNDGVEIVMGLQNPQKRVQYFHVVSVRNHHETGEAVMRFLNAIVADLNLTAVLMNSGIGVKDKARKEVEQKIFDVLSNAEGKGKPLYVENLTGDGPPSSCVTLARMSQLEFKDLLKEHEKSFNDTVEREELIMNHEELHDIYSSSSLAVNTKSKETSQESTEPRKETEPKAIKELLGPEHLREARHFMEGHGTLHERLFDLPSKMGCYRAGIVDPGSSKIPPIDPALERIFHSRSFVRFWCTQESPARFLPGSQISIPQTVIAGAWEWNWSNLAFT